MAAVFLCSRLRGDDLTMAMVPVPVRMALYGDGVLSGSSPGLIGKTS
jgi:hypothetical protein